MLPTFNKTRSFFSTVDQGKVANAQDKLATAATTQNTLQGQTGVRTDAGTNINKTANSVADAGKNFNLTGGLGSTKAAGNAQVITSGVTQIGRAHV